MQKAIGSNQILNLVDKIYGAACEPEQWSAVAEQIQSAVGGHSVNIALEDTKNPNFRFFFTNGATQSDVAYYEENIIGRDDFNHLLESIDCNTVLLTQQVWDEKLLHQHYPYEEFYESLGYAYFNASLFYRDEEKRGWLSVVRSVSDKQFSEADLRLMQQLTPHLHRSFLINMHLFEAHGFQQMSLDALEHLSAGVIFLSSDGHYVHSNSKAQKYLRSINNMKQNYRVKLPDHSANLDLQKAIAEVLHSNKSLLGRFICFYEEGERHTVMCLPWKMNEQSYGWLNNQVGCLLFIVSSTRALASAERLRKFFDVSKAESLVLSGVINGYSAGALAQKLFLSETTIRFHIKNLLRKFSAHNQIEMLSKINRLLDIGID